MRTPTEHIKTLQRRIDFLKSRQHQNSFDLAELGSLEWAVVNLSVNRKPLELTNIKRIATYCGEHITDEDVIEITRRIEQEHGIKEQL